MTRGCPVRRLVRSIARVVQMRKRERRDCYHRLEADALDGVSLNSVDLASGLAEGTVPKLTAAPPVEG